jgi:hypothetical protein
LIPARSEEFAAYGLKRKQAPTKVSHGKRLFNNKDIGCYRIIIAMRLRKFTTTGINCAG